MIKKSATFIIILILIGVCSSCNIERKKEVFIKPSEIGVYYDAYLKKTVVLNSGKHSIPKVIVPSIYPIEPVKITQNAQFATKDGKQITFEVSFWYSVNPNKIEELNKEYGRDYLELFVLPKVLFEILESIREIDYVNMNTYDIEKITVSKLENDIAFSNFIKTKAIKLKNRGN